MKLNKNVLKKMIRTAILEQAAVSSDVAAAQKKYGQVAGIENLEKKINTPVEGSQAILDTVKGYGLDHKDQIRALVMAVNALRGQKPQAGVAVEALDPVGKEDKDIDNDGDVDSSDKYLKRRRDAIGKNMKKEAMEDRPYDRHEDGYRKSTSWGEIPDADELYELMNGDPFDMFLQGADSLAFDYAIDVSSNPQAGSMAAGEGMRATLQALVDAPEPDDLTDEQYEDVEATLDAWYEKYGDESIADTAHSVASSIMDVLGVEWI